MCAVAGTNGIYTHCVSLLVVVGVFVSYLFCMLASSGGVFMVHDTASATFDNDVIMAGNSVSDGYSGGVIYTDGRVSGNCGFPYERWRLVKTKTRNAQHHISTILICLMSYKGGSKRGIQLRKKSEVA